MFNAAVRCWISHDLPGSEQSSVGEFLPHRWRKTPRRACQAIFRLLRFQPRTMIERARGQRPRRSFLDCCGGNRACFITIRNESRTKRTSERLLIYEAASVARFLCDIAAATSRARKETVHPYAP